GGGLIELAGLEVDEAQRLLVAAAAKPHRDAAVVVAPAGRNLAFGQRLDWLAAVKRGAVDEHQLALARGRRLEGFECHGARLTTRWSRRCGDPLRASRSLSSRPTARRASRETP